MLSRRFTGFALPSIMIASVVMLMVLAAAISSVATTRGALTDQYYNQIAKEAAESGLAMADACIKSGTLTWPNPLRPGSDCNGAESQCSSEGCYLLDSGKTRTTFSVDAPLNPGETSTAHAIGTVELTRTSNDAVWKSYSQDINKIEQGEGRKLFWSAVSTSNNHTCAIGITGKAYCWGSGWAGQIGNGTTLSSNPEPLAVTMSGSLAGRSFNSISAGGVHTCAIATDMNAYCWGSNGSGTLGNNSTASSSLPVAVNTSGVLAGKSILDIQAGYSHTCVIASDNKVYCWGENTFGQLGNNSTSSSSVPVAVNTSGALSGKAIRALAAGDNHTCAIASDGQVYCWGMNWDGQLGNNSTSNSSVPVAVNTTGVLSGKTIRSVAAGSSYVCVIASDVKAYCWGDNPYGQLGNSSTTDSSVPVAVNAAGVLAGKTIRSIATGSNHTCAIASDNKAYCWGWNASYGQLGSASTSDSSVPVAVAGALQNKTVVGIDTGYVHTCAVTSDNTIFCWGGNFNGQLGNGTTTATDITEPSTVKAISDNAGGPRSNGTISVGATHTCATGSDSKAYCWGSNANGYLGNCDSSVGNNGTGTQVPIYSARCGGLTNKTLKTVDTGDSRSCAIASDDLVYCWGYQPNGGWYSIPTSVHTTGALVGKTVKELSVGGSITCVIANDDLPYCWGRQDSWGGVGDNKVSSGTNPAAVVTSGVLAGKTIRQISSGGNHNCAIASDGKVYCWGYNGSGQLGTGNTTWAAVPVAVNMSGVLAGKTAKYVSAGGSGTCIIASDDKAYCWGNNSYGDLGINSSVTNSTVPVAVDTSGVLAGKDIRSIASGSYYTCVVASDDKAYCWGYNAQGQLGIGTTANSLAPVAVGGDFTTKKVKEIVPGHYHICAVTMDDEFYCWGLGNSGQLGRGSSASATTPAKVNPLPDYPPIEHRKIYY